MVTSHSPSLLLPPVLQAGPLQPGSVVLTLGCEGGSGGSSEFNGMSPQTRKPCICLQLSLCSAAGFSCTLLAARHHCSIEGDVVSF